MGKSMKLSQLDLLKESVVQLLSKNPGGQDNPFVKGLKAQIASIEKTRADNPMQSISVGMRSAPPMSSDPRSETPPAATTSKLPDAPTRSQFHSQEEFEEAQGYWQRHVGRIKGLIDLAAHSKGSQAK